MRNFENETDKKLYIKSIESTIKKIDPKTGLVKSWRGENGYHSRLKNCYCSSVGANLSFAIRLLEYSPEKYLDKAVEIINKVIDVQDTDESSDSFGVWPYFFEESIKEMDAPDWNMADFQGKDLIKILINFGDILSDELKNKIKTAINNACFAIVKRDMGAIYTNVSVMDCYVTIVAGDMFGWDNYYEYGCKKLKALYDYNMENGSFSEYNSPCYTFVTLYDLCSLISDVKNEECQKYIKALYDLAWETIAVHFHKPTNQMSGPHFRAYDMFMPKEHIFAIEKAIKGRAKLLDDAQIEEYFPNGVEYNENLICPEKFVKYFTDEPNDNVIDITFAPSLMAYTYQNSKYTLGSIHSEKLWNQHRNILAYWGTKYEPLALNIKCLHDGWDYCSCLTSTVQDKGKVLTALGFLTDQGDSHVTLDMVKDKKIEAEDFRICWQFSGNVQHIECEKISETSYRFSDKKNGLKFDISFENIMFEGFNPQIELKRTNSLDDTAVSAGISNIGNKERQNANIEFSVILYKGERKTIDFGKMSEAVLVSSLSITDSDDNSNNAISCSVEDKFLTAEFENLKITTPIFPQAQQEKIDSTKLFRNKTEYKPEF